MLKSESEKYSSILFVIKQQLMQIYKVFQCFSYCIFVKDTS